MSYRRAVIPALVGSLLITLFLWWAGASAPALQLRGTTNVFTFSPRRELQRWLTPWSYDPRARRCPADPGAGTRR